MDLYQHIPSRTGEANERPEQWDDKILQRDDGKLFYQAYSYTREGVRLMILIPILVTIFCLSFIASWLSESS